MLVLSSTSVSAMFLSLLMLLFCQVSVRRDGFLPEEVSVEKRGIRLACAPLGMEELVSVFVQEKI